MTEPLLLAIGGLLTALAIALPNPTTRWSFNLLLAVAGAIFFGVVVVLELAH